MKILKKLKLLTLLVVFTYTLLFATTTSVSAATTPDLGQAASFGILSNTYTNTVGGTTINGDLGYTTGPATTPTVNGTTYDALTAKYTAAGIDQGAALTNLNSQPCTHTFPAGAVDLATDTSHGTIGIYAPGVYCTAASSAASIGAGGITLTGTGTYIFRIDGALTTVANSVVSSASGANSCDVFWTPNAATTLGANSTFFGTDIDDSGITIGSTVSWTGRALAFGGTVSTDTDTITAPTCTAAPTPPTSSSSSTSTSGGSSAPSCPALASSIIAPNITESRRVAADSIFISWGPNSGVDKFIVEYGFENGKWLYNTNVTGFSTTINGLPSNQPIWFRVAARNDCMVGSFGEAKLVGGSVRTGGAGQVLGVSTSTKGPLLPNAGIGPKSYAPFYIPAGIIVGILIFLYLMQRKHRLSPKS